MATLLLFDIDGTLVHIPAGRQALRSAFAELFGVAEAVDEFDFSGQTDRAAFRELAARSGCPQADFSRIVSRYLVHLRRELMNDPGRSLAGAAELISRCRGNKHFHLALGTGNVEPAARLKLAAHGLDQYFPVGGFGDDAVDRPGILRAAVEKASAYYEHSYQQVIVIGDAPEDIAAARAIGAKAVAVATGRPTARQLARVEPDLLLPSLSPAAEAYAALNRLSGWS